MLLKFGQKFHQRNLTLKCLTVKCNGCESGHSATPMNMKLQQAMAGNMG
jgi:hypothetical protein